MVHNVSPVAMFFVVAKCYHKFNNNFIRITSRTDSTIMKISGAIKTSVRAAVHNYYPKATKEKGTNSTQKTAVAYRFRKEIYRILSCT